MKVEILMSIMYTFSFPVSKHTFLTIYFSMALYKKQSLQLHILSKKSEDTRSLLKTCENLFCAQLLGNFII